MKKRFDEEQIVRMLREADVSGVQVREVCRRHNITEQTFFRWLRDQRVEPLLPSSCCNSRSRLYNSELGVRPTQEL